MWKLVYHFLPDFSEVPGSVQLNNLEPKSGEQKDVSNQYVEMVIQLFKNMVRGPIWIPDFGTCKNRRFWYDEPGGECVMHFGCLTPEAQRVMRKEGFLRLHLDRQAKLEFHRLRRRPVHESEGEKYEFART